MGCSLESSQCGGSNKHQKLMFGTCIKNAIHRAIKDSFMLHGYVLLLKFSSSEGDAPGHPFTGCPSGRVQALTAQMFQLERPEKDSGLSACIYWLIRVQNGRSCPKVSIRIFP